MNRQLAIAVGIPLCELKAVVANFPVVDWSILHKAEKAETSKKNYAEYIREAFENGYRLSDANWCKLRSGTFYNPWYHRNEIDGSKLLMFHAKDDPNGGGHISTDYVVRKYRQQIKRFFNAV